MEGWNTGGPKENFTSEVVNDFETAETNSFLTTDAVVENSMTPGSHDDAVYHELEKQKRILSGPLLPSQV